MSVFEFTVRMEADNLEEAQLFMAQIAEDGQWHGENQPKYFGYSYEGQIE